MGKCDLKITPEVTLPACRKLDFTPLGRFHSVFTRPLGKLHTGAFPVHLGVPAGLELPFSSLALFWHQLGQQLPSATSQSCVYFAIGVWAWTE